MNKEIYERQLKEFAEFQKIQSQIESFKNDPLVVIHEDSKIELLEDKLKQLFEMQKALDDDIVAKHPDKTDKDVSEWVIGLTIAMESEIDEIRREVNWKWWKGQKEINQDNLRNEIVDMWHFVISLSQKVGMDYQEVFDRYVEKNKENFARQLGKSIEGNAYDYREGQE